MIQPPDRSRILLAGLAGPPRWRVPPALVAAFIVLVMTVAPLPAAEGPGPAPPLPPRALVRFGAAGLRTRQTITGIAFSPDGRLVAAGYQDQSSMPVAIFDVRTGREIRRLIVPNANDWPWRIAFSPDGSRLLCGGSGLGEVLLWDPAGGRLLFRGKLHRDMVNAVGFSPDGRLMASAGFDGEIHMRRVADPARPYRDLAPGMDPESPPSPPGSAGVGSLAFTPDSTRLVAGTRSRPTISIWQIDDGRLLRRIAEAHGRPDQSGEPDMECLAVTPDGRRIMSSGVNVAPIAKTRLKYGPDDVTMNEVRFWDIETGKRLSDLGGDEDAGYGYAALSPDGRRVAVSDFGRLRILDAATGERERLIELPGYPGSVPVFSPDGSVVALPIENAVVLFEVRTGRRLDHDETTPVGPMVSAAWSPAGDRIVTGHVDGFVRAWDAATGKLIWHQLLAPVVSRLGENALPLSVGFSRDGRLVLASGRRDDPVDHREGLIAVYDAEDGRPRHRLVQPKMAGAALARDGRMVVAAIPQENQRQIRLVGVEVATGRTRWSAPAEATAAGFAPVCAMQFRPGSPFVAVVLEDGRVIRLNALTGREQDRLRAGGWLPIPGAGPGRDGLLWNGAFSPDGRTVAGQYAGWLGAWDVESGAPRGKIDTTHEGGYLVAVGPDGRTLAIADRPRHDAPGRDAIRLHDIETDRTVLTLEPGDDRAVVLAFSPDGSRLLSGFQRGSAIIWDVRRGP